MFNDFTYNSVLLNTRPVSATLKTWMSRTKLGKEGPVVNAVTDVSSGTKVEAEPRP